ncbi:MAG: hypothetical protein ABI480_02385 [Chitinophagaceae bacterium]
MLTTEEILFTLDHCDDAGLFNFISLSHPYVYLIDCRINVFRDSFGKWAIVSEVLGYNPRGESIRLEIRYFGNCLVNLEVENGQTYNYYNVEPIDWDSFNETIENERLKPDAAFWLVRGVQIPLSHNKQDYVDDGIKLREYKPDEISAEEVGRLIIQQDRHLFRATDAELNKSIPDGLDKILVIDEWYHKEFSQSKSAFEKKEMLSRFDLSNEFIKQMIQQDLELKANHNKELWNDRPGSYETWQQIAEVIVTGDPSRYKPTVAPNSHWKNWPEGGTM